MEITDLRIKPDTEQHLKLRKRLLELDKLVHELKKWPLNPTTISHVNENIGQVNSFSGSDHELQKLVKGAQKSILKMLEKDLRIVPKHHYRNLWMALGMSVFGLPLGVAFGASLSNIAFLSIGLPIGMSVGMAVGAGMDKKASAEGRQLDFELKY